VKRTLATSDGLTLEAEWSASPGTTRAVAVLCHPHPQYGGTMRSIVTSALFETLPTRGFDCLRFNFRGVEGSGGEHSGGVDEPRDVIAALDAASAAASGSPIALIGWSFGADVALVVADARIAAWVAIAPPLRFRAATDYAPVAHDARPKLLLLAAHDEYRAPADVEVEVASWDATRVEVIAGASHFFVGRTDQVVDRTADFLGALNP
jgi:alpha/beta superfamily hydrolase